MNRIIITSADQFDGKHIYVCTNVPGGDDYSVNITRQGAEDMLGAAQRSMSWLALMAESWGEDALVLYFQEKNYED